MGMGGLCRHGALRPTPVPSALTYFQSGFYLDQTQGPLQKDSVWFFLCRLFMTLPERWNGPNHRPIGEYTILKIHTYVHTHGASPSPPTNENKLHVWNIKEQTLWTRPHCTMDSAALTTPLQKEPWLTDNRSQMQMQSACKTPDPLSTPGF